MLTSVDDVLDRVKTRLGRLAERAADPTLAPNSSDDADLKDLLGDALAELCKRTDRYETTTTPQTTAAQAYVALPPHIDVIQEAYAIDGSTAHEMKVYDGADVARAAQSPNADSGRPKFIGEHAGKLWLHPVPDAQYELQLTCTMNGAYGNNKPADDTDPPVLDTLADRTPSELERALVAYVSAEWMRDSGQPEIADGQMTRFERDLRKYDGDPRRQRTHPRDYNPLGL